MAVQIETKLFGEEARTVAARLDLKMDGETTDLNRKVWFTYRSVEGHPVLVVEMEI